MELKWEGETLYLDPIREAFPLCTAQELFDLGYRWAGGPQEPNPEPDPEEVAEMGLDLEDGEDAGGEPRQD